MEQAPAIRLSDYDYSLPPDAIAQEPATPRDAARLLVLDRETGALAHRVFRDLPDLLRAGDLLVVNETRVTAVRLFGASGGVPVEILLLRPVLEAADTWEALVRPGRKVRPGDRVCFAEAGLSADVLSITAGGERVLRFVAADGGGEVTEILARHGRVPLPPYITAPLADPDRYQTVYARTPGSAAAPTAGLHFTPELFARLEMRGVRSARVRLDVGLGTFRPIKTDDLDAHIMHEEAFEVPSETADAVNSCSGRVVAVGTTTLRALETAARALPPGADERRVAPARGETRLFVRPGHRFRAVDALVTNFHQPHSTLLLLVGAFAGRTIPEGRAHLQAAYQAALAQGYRFLSLGDAMFLVNAGDA